VSEIENKCNHPEELSTKAEKVASSQKKVKSDIWNVESKTQDEQMSSGLSN
jgi:hypothetical protein